MASSLVGALRYDIVVDALGAKKGLQKARQEFDKHAARMKDYQKRRGQGANVTTALKKSGLTSSLATYGLAAAAVAYLAKQFYDIGKRMVQWVFAGAEKTARRMIAARQGGITTQRALAREMADADPFQQGMRAQLETLERLGIKQNYERDRMLGNLETARGEFDLVIGDLASSLQMLAADVLVPMTNFTTRFIQNTKTATALRWYAEFRNRFRTTAQPPPDIDIPAAMAGGRAPNMGTYEAGSRELYNLRVERQKQRNDAQLQIQQRLLEVQLGAYDELKKLAQETDPFTRDESGAITGARNDLFNEPMQ